MQKKKQKQKTTSYWSTGMFTEKENFTGKTRQIMEKTNQVPERNSLQKRLRDQHYALSVPELRIRNSDFADSSYKIFKFSS